MTILYLLIPLSLFMGLVGFAVFLWSVRNGQYEDLAGAAERILYDADAPETQPRHERATGTKETRR